MASPLDYLALGVLGGLVDNWGEHQSQKQLQNLANYINAQTQSFTSPTPTAEDITNAQNTFIKQGGASDIVGQNAGQFLADNQAKWDQLEQQRQQYLAAGNQDAADQIQQQQQRLHLTSELARQILKNQGFDMTGLGADNNVAAALAARNVLAPASNAATPQTFQPTSTQTNVGNNLLNAIMAKNNFLPPNISSSDFDRLGSLTSTNSSFNGAQPTSILPPPVNPKDVSSYKFTAEDALKTLGVGNDVVTNLAKALAKERAMASFNPNALNQDVINYMIQHGITGENFKTGLSLINGITGGLQSQIQQAQNNKFASALQEAIEKGDYNRANALIQAYAGKAGDYKTLMQYGNNYLPNYKETNVDLGNAVRTDIIPTNGIGRGYSVSAPKGYSPDAVLNANTTIRKTQMENDTALKKAMIQAQAGITEARIRGNATLGAAGIHADAVIQAAKLSQANKLDPVSKDIVDTVTNAITDPDAWKQLNSSPQGQQMLQVYAGIVQNYSGSSGSGKISDAEYDTLYNKLVHDYGYTPAQAQDYIQRNYW